jgi:NitT/TauT family transport system substrate-binding protein
MKKHLLSTLLLSASSLFFFGCGESAPEANESGLTKVTLLNDWYAQPEHGGFYQAFAEGYYAEAGLDVTIVPGGPNTMGAQKVATQQVEFSIGRADDIIVQIGNGVPLMIVGALMQHDPQALMAHEESGITSFKDLDERAVMTTPGSPMIQFLQKRYDITINTLPVDYGMSRFLADKEFVQQCFITNEPYYVRKEGANVKTLLLADSGYDPYRIIYTSRSFAQKNPEIVKAFVAASVKGWQSYMAGPREKANAIIAASNPKMTEEFMAYAVNSMQENNLIAGYSDVDETGLIQPKRMQSLIDDLYEIGTLKKQLKAEEIAPSKFLPEYLQAMIDSPTE